MAVGIREVVYFPYVGHWLPIIYCLCCLATGTIERQPALRSSNSAERVWCGWTRCLIFWESVDRIWLDFSAKVILSPLPCMHLLKCFKLVQLTFSRWQLGSLTLRRICLPSSRPSPMQLGDTLGRFYSESPGLESHSHYTPSKDFFFIFSIQ